MKTFKLPYSELTPAKALELLRHGNFRFINKLAFDRDHIDSVDLTKDGQTPFAAIVSCMDSRTSAELIFDQGFGDVFSLRVAGNVISTDILGSLEYATAVAGSKLIVVLGHTNCGAVIGACNHVKLGNLSPLLAKIEPAVMTEQTIQNNRNGENLQFVNAVAKLHTIYSVQEIISKSEIIKGLIDEGKVGIIPAIYDLATGKVTFFDQEATINIQEKNKNEAMAMA